MPEPLTTQLVADVIRELLIAFPSKHTDRNLIHTADVYRDGLVGLSGDALRAAAKVSIQSDNYFPKIARLRELATEWQKRNAVTMPDRPASRVCQTCRQEAKPTTRWRPKVDAAYRELRSADGLYVLLERFERDLCECAPPCWYEPQQGLSEPACHVNDVQRTYKAWLELRRDSRSKESNNAA